LEPTNSILKINNIEVKYHEVILVIKGVSIEVPEGGIVALLGANGAGKSTILKAISGLLKHENGQVTDGLDRIHGSAHRTACRREDCQAGHRAGDRGRASSSTSRWSRTSRWAPHA